MYTVRHYLVRLRWSKRRPYLVARRTLALALALLVTVVALDLLGVSIPHRLEHLWP